MKSGIGPAGRIGHAAIDSKLTPLLVIAALALGVLAVALTPREEEPQIVLPVMDIFVGLPGADPAEVEDQVTLPLEKRMWEIPGVEYVYSVSMPDMALVTVRFLVGDDQERSLVRVYDKLVSGMPAMPAGSTMPLVRTRTIDDVPVLGLTLWSDRYDHFQLRRIAVELKREISSLDSVSDIEVLGGQRRQLRVLLDAQKLASRQLDPVLLVQALQAQNATLPAGTYESANRQILVETSAYLTSREEVESLVVGVWQGRPVRLAEVARVIDGPEDPLDYVFFMPGPAAAEERVAAGRGSGGTAPAVTLAVAKRKGSDAHRVVESVLEKVDLLRGDLVPAGVEMTVTRDYGATSNEKAGELLWHLVGAIVSVTIVIGAFLTPRWEQQVR